MFDSLLCGGQTDKHTHRWVAYVWRDIDALMLEVPNSIFNCATMNRQNGNPAAPPGYPFPRFVYMAAPVQRQDPHVMHYYPFGHFPQYVAALPRPQFQFAPVFVPPAAYQAAAFANYQRVQRRLAEQYTFHRAQLAAMIPVAQVPEVVPEAVKEEPQEAGIADETDDEDEIIDVETISGPPSPAATDEVNTNGFAIASPLLARSPSSGVAPQSPVPMPVDPVVIKEEASPLNNGFPGFPVVSPFPSRSPSPGVAPRAQSPVPMPVDPVVIKEEATPSINRLSVTPPQPLIDDVPVEPERTVTSTNTADTVNDRPIVRPHWYETLREMSPAILSDISRSRHGHAHGHAVVLQRCARMRTINDRSAATSQAVIPRNANAPTRCRMVDPLAGINPVLRSRCAAGIFCILLEFYPRLTGPAQWVRCGNRHANRWFHSVCVRMQNSKFRKSTRFFCCGKAQTQEGRSAVTGAIWRRWKSTLAREGTLCRSEVMKKEARRKKK
ncbi:hypothetical protein CRE_22467 [Caenorhabditis remanei]|uniref:Uncharacterized protein n=1 Tax=Caenorhabditis remanei TaxID=31234 RepID=E3MED5_CAERE|nr:hypothetical protein CRE_22467 [Caenorhabditis remanei]